jgi:hypothetical protein
MERPQVRLLPAPVKSSRLWMTEPEPRGKEEGGICEDHPVAALSMAGEGTAWLAIRAVMPSGAVAVVGWPQALGMAQMMRLPQGRFASATSEVPLIRLAEMGLR